MPRRTRNYIESDVEKHLFTKVAEMGGWAVKLSCPGTTGFPDRMIMLPYGVVSFAELKRPGEKPRPSQVDRMETMTHQYGMDVWWADTEAEVDKQLARLAQEIEKARLSGKAKVTPIYGPAVQLKGIQTFYIG